MPIRCRQPREIKMNKLGELAGRAWIGFMRVSFMRVSFMRVSFMRVSVIVLFVQLLM